MKNVTRFASVFVLSVALVGTSIGQPPAQPQPAPRSVVTVITIPKMDCGGCAKKIGTQLYAVQGVGQVAQNLDTFQLFVTPHPNVGVSPRLLWEAVEKAGFAPSRMDSPYGAFVTKPQN